MLPWHFQSFYGDSLLFSRTVFFLIHFARRQYITLTLPEYFYIYLTFVWNRQAPTVPHRLLNPDLTEHSFLHVTIVHFTATPVRFRSCTAMQVHQGQRIGRRPRWLLRRGLEVHIYSGRSVHGRGWSSVRYVNATSSHSFGSLFFFVGSMVPITVICIPPGHHA